MNEQHEREKRDAALAEFIARLKTRTAMRPRETELPEVHDAIVRQVQHPARLVELFAERATKAGASVEYVTAEGWPTPVLELLAQHKAKRVLVEVAACPPVLAAGFDALRGELSDTDVEVLAGVSDEVLYAADVAVTPVRLAIAETGSLVIDTGDGASRSASLIPPIHCAIVAGSQIVADLHDGLNALAPGEGPACTTLITGPSKTADIEGALVTGMHGPGVLRILVVDDTTGG